MTGPRTSICDSQMDRMEMDNVQKVHSIYKKYEIPIKLIKNITYSINSQMKNGNWYTKLCHRCPL